MNQKTLYILLEGQAGKINRITRVKTERLIKNLEHGQCLILTNNHVNRVGLLLPANTTTSIIKELTSLYPQHRVNTMKELDHYPSSLYNLILS